MFVPCMLFALWRARLFAAWLLVYFVSYTVANLSLFPEKFLTARLLSLPCSSTPISCTIAIVQGHIGMASTQVRD
jgi:hypothetical protein